MMRSEIFWLMLTLLATALMWLPYILHVLIKFGPRAGMGYSVEPKDMAPWAQRAKKAHYNAVENLVLFAPSVLVFHALVGSAEVQIACQTSIYFFARIAHYLFYTFKVSYLRTLSFAIGWGVQLCIFYKIFKLLCPSCTT